MKVKNFYYGICDVLHGHLNNVWAFHVGSHKREPMHTCLLNCMHLKLLKAKHWFPMQDQLIERLAQLSNIIIVAYNCHYFTLKCFLLYQSNFL